MRFIFDNNLSIGLAKAIGALSRQEYVVEQVHHLKELFPQSADDVVWLNRLQDHGPHWVVVTNDKFKKQGGDERERSLSSAVENGIGAQADFLPAFT